MSSSSYQPSPAFKSAADYVANDPSLKKIGNDTKLQLYALYKLVTVSRAPEGSRPGIFDFQGRAKWDAWASASKEFEGKSTEEVEQQYIEVCKGLGWSGQETAPDVGAGAETKGSGGGTGMGVRMSVLERDEEQHWEDHSLHGAVIRGDLEAVKTILDKDTSNIDSLDKYGFTALHLAADRGFASIVRLLLDKGANVGVKDPDGETAISLSKAAGHEEIATMIQQLLLNHGRDGQDI